MLEFMTQFFSANCLRDQVISWLVNVTYDIVPPTQKLCVSNHFLEEHVERFIGLPGGLHFFGDVFRKRRTPLIPKPIAVKYGPELRDFLLARNAYKL